ncbi:hypothetical protein KIPB_004895 [Kipferlia bialata]|uniref:Uncharacterized protein n=1 Tax=Kipferlia bialata TaxID=797122 RepID=A0A9K3CV75_9EUKA|nr:hypothetical protein KIPB_004895 [Kipferlia bialata]|eukprot:g4895.t1
MGNSLGKPERLQRLRRQARESIPPLERHDTLRIEYVHERGQFQISGPPHMRSAPAFSPAMRMVNVLNAGLQGGNEDNVLSCTDIYKAVNVVRIVGLSVGGGMILLGLILFMALSEPVILYAVGGAGLLMLIIMFSVSFCVRAQVRSVARHVSRDPAVVSCCYSSLNEDMIGSTVSLCDASVEPVKWVSAYCTNKTQKSVTGTLKLRDMLPEAVMMWPQIRAMIPVAGKPNRGGQADLIAKIPHWSVALYIDVPFDVSGGQGTTMQGQVPQPIYQQPPTSYPSAPIPPYPSADAVPSAPAAVSSTASIAVEPHPYPVAPAPYGYTNPGTGGEGVSGVYSQSGQYNV